MGVHPLTAWNVAAFRSAHAEARALMEDLVKQQKTPTKGSVLECPKCRQRVVVVVAGSQAECHRKHERVRMVELVDQ